MAHTSTSPTCQTRHAVILAAGESKRTRPLTLHQPKPLLRLVDRPLLAHILDQLVGLIERVTLVVGYRAAMLRATMGTDYRGIQLDYVTQHTVNGTAGALLTVAEQGKLDGPFFLLYGDNLVSQRDIVNVCEQRYAMAALPVDDPTGFGILDVENGSVLRIIEKPPHAPPGSLSNPGIFHFDEHVLPALRQIEPSPRGEYELTDLIEALACENAVGYRVCQGYWVPVGNPWEALIASLFLLEQRANLRATVHPEADIAPGCTIEGNVTVGRATIGAGCTITGPAFIDDGVSIGDNCTISRAVLETGAKVGKRCTITSSVLGQQTRMGADSLLEYSLLDSAAALASGTWIAARTFADIQPVAATGGLLTPESFIQRGVVLGQQVTIIPETAPQPGTVVFPDEHSPAE